MAIAGVGAMPIQAKGPVEAFDPFAEAEEDDLASETPLDPKDLEDIEVLAIARDGVKTPLMMARGATVSEVRCRLGAELGVERSQLELEHHDSKPMDLPRELAWTRQKGVEVPVVRFILVESRLDCLLKRKKLKDVCSRSPWGRTALHFAVINGDNELIEELLERRDGYGVPIFKEPWINSRDGYGDTALMLATVMGFDDILELLLEREATVHSQNMYGRTAIMLASEHGHWRCVEHLLEAGASLAEAPGPRSPRTDTKMTAPKLAKLNRREKVKTVMKNHIAALAEEAAPAETEAPVEVAQVGQLPPAGGA